MFIRESCFSQGLDFGNNLNDATNIASKNYVPKQTFHTEHPNKGSDRLNIWSTSIYSYHMPGM